MWTTHSWTTRNLARIVYTSYRTKISCWTTSFITTRYLIMSHLTKSCLTTCSVAMYDFRYIHTLIWHQKTFTTINELFCHAIMSFPAIRCPAVIVGWPKNLLFVMVSCFQVESYLFLAIYLLNIQSSNGSEINHQVGINSVH